MDSRTLNSDTQPFGQNSFWSGVNLRHKQNQNTMES